MATSRQAGINRSRQIFLPAGIVGITMALANCAHVTPRDNPPDLSFSTSATLDDATACVISALNAEVEGITHSASFIVPGKAYEIRPVQDITLTAEIYYATATRHGDNTTVEVFAISTWARKIVSAVRRCDK